MLKTLGRGMSILTSISTAPSFILSQIPNYYADYNGDAPETFVLQNDTELIGLNDFSGNGHDLDLVSDTPLRAHERTIEGVPAISNMGAGSLKCENFGIDPSIDEFTMFVIAMVDSASNDIIWGWDGNVLRQIVYSGLASNIIDNGAGFNKSVATAGSFDKGGISVFAHDPNGTSETRFNKAQITTTSNVSLSSSTTFVLGSAPFGNTNNAMKGAIGRVVIFNRKLSLQEIQIAEDHLEQVFRLASLMNNDVAGIAAGQSLIHYQFSQGGGIGAQNTRDALANYFGGTVSFESGAQGATSVVQTNASAGFPDRWYYNHITGQFGPTYDLWSAAADAAVAAGVEIKFILWDQGEQDASFINTSTANYNIYDAATKIVWAQMRAKIGRNVPIIICPIGRNAYGSDSGGTQKMREWQFAQRFNVNNLYVMSGKTHLDLTDSVHLTQAGRETLGTLQGHFIGKLLGRGGTTPVIPPNITSVVRSGTTVTISVQHREDSDFVPTVNINGCVFFEGGYPGYQTSGTVMPWATRPTRIDANTFQGTLQSTPSGGDEFLVYQQSSMSAASAGEAVTNADNNLVIDNSAAALPFAPAVFADTGNGFVKIAGG